MAQVLGPHFDKREYLGDTLDLKLREGLKDFHPGGKDTPDHTLGLLDREDLKNNNFYMPYKNLRSTDPMPMMAIDDSTHFTLRIKDYHNYYRPERIDPELYNYRGQKKKTPFKDQ